MKVKHISSSILCLVGIHACSSALFSIYITSGIESISMNTRRSKKKTTTIVWIQFVSFVTLFDGYFSVQ